jgi:asparagine synthase (glutamine-hydrolysing)
MHIAGWVEIGGKRLSPDEVREAVKGDPATVMHFGGEFSISWDDCRVRDHFGIMPAEIPAGTVVCGGHAAGMVNPVPGPYSTEEAIVTAIRLRSDEGIVALSGGVDSSLVAYLAGLPCVIVGIEGSHDLKRGVYVAELLGLPYDTVVPTFREIEETLAQVVQVSPAFTPVTVSIATTLAFVSRFARDRGETRILIGQGADELFGGYSRYLRSTTLDQDMERDFQALLEQLVQDQAVAALHGAYFSLPYLDVRVVRAALAIPPHEKVTGGIRKRALRLIAERYIPPEIAWYEKKAMQYGSGVWRTIQQLARRNGYTCVADYMRSLA